MNLALGELPNFTCLPGRGAHLRGAISISPSVEYLERAYDEAKYGEFSRRPYLDIVIPSLIDPAMAPPGKHVMSIFAQYAPYQLNGGWTDARREAFGDAVVDTLAEYAPNLKRAILHRQVITPADIERMVGHQRRQHLPGRAVAAADVLPAAGAGLGASTARRSAACTSAARERTRAAASWARPARNAARGDPEERRVSAHDVVIGAGANELVAAHYLARAGRRVLVLAPRADERRPEWLGCRRQSCAISAWRSGACSIVRARSVGDGAAPRRRPPRAVAGHGALGRVDPAPERARCGEWPAFCARMARLARLLETVYIAPPPDPSARGRRDLAQLAGLALRARGLGDRGSRTCCASRRCRSRTCSTTGSRAMR